MNGLDLLKGIGEINDDLVEESYIENTGTSKVAHFVIWKRWSSAAACLLCIGIVSGIAYRVHSDSIKENTPETAAMDIAVQALPPEDGTGNTDEIMEVAPYVVVEDNASEECNLESAKQESIESSSVHDWSAYTIISEYPGEMNAIYCYGEPRQGNYFLYQYLSDTLAQNETADMTHPFAYNVNVDVFAYDDLSDQHSRHLSGETETDQQLLTREYERLLDLGYDVYLSDSYQLSGIFTKEELNDFPVNEKYGYTIYFANEP